jgi:hypothetical protein
MGRSESRWSHQRLGPPKLQPTAVWRLPQCGLATPCQRLSTVPAVSRQDCAGGTRRSPVPSVTLHKIYSTNIIIAAGDALACHRLVELGPPWVDIRLSRNRPGLL